MITLYHGSTVSIERISSTYRMKSLNLPNENPSTCRMKKPQLAEQNGLVACVSKKTIIPLRCLKRDTKWKQAIHIAHVWQTGCCVNSLKRLGLCWCKVPNGVARQPLQHNWQRVHCTWTIPARFATTCFWQRTTLSFCWLAKLQDWWTSGSLHRNSGTRRDTW